MTDPDVLGSPAEGRSEPLWSRLPPRRQSMVKAALAVVVAAAVVAYGVSEGRGRLRQRALEDMVSLSAELNVSSSSMTPTGGRVDFYLAVENTGELPVTISSVAAVAPRLRITGQLTGRGLPVRPVEPAQVARVPLSVVLDCRASGATPAPTEELVAAVQASPASGRGRSVEVAVSQSSLVTDIADTLCAINPDISGDELDGPVAVP